MPRGSSPAPALLVASVLGRTPDLVNAAISAFAGQHGTPGFVSEAMAFCCTDYYGEELGDRPCRRFVAVRPLLADPSALGGIKRSACRLEVALGRAGGPGRPVNIDPGTLNAGQLVLASTKPRDHRIYLGQGIYGDLMLRWDGAGFAALPWTYPDYASEELRQLFGQLRGLYLALCRAGSEPCTP